MKLTVTCAAAASIVLGSAALAQIDRVPSPLPPASPFIEAQQAGELL